VCGYRGCLIADQDGIYDPGTTNGRLLLGLKGQLAELELHTLRARMTAGLLNKARRGERALSLPIGLVRDSADRVRHPILIARCKIASIWSLRSFCVSDREAQVLEFLNSHELFLPRRDRFGDLVWKRPTVAAILQILKNPAYAGDARLRTHEHRARRSGLPSCQAGSAPAGAVEDPCQ
jgi:DNA invertase Pin-like site-specific DNA recombinase